MTKQEMKDTIEYRHFKIFGLILGILSFSCIVSFVVFSIKLFPKGSYSDIELVLYVFHALVYLLSLGVSIWCGYRWGRIVKGREKYRLREVTITDSRLGFRAWQLYCEAVMEEPYRRIKFTIYTRGYLHGNEMNSGDTVLVWYNAENNTAIFKSKKKN